ncbi:MAG: hypothetical protein GY749_44940 [Desulfobacteraceae bacterium]|nr:hypothetical protein [Desulfobacteraceae bacterium]
MKSIFYILFAGIDSGFFCINFLQKWTEHLINNSESPQDWLIDLTMCSDTESALNILRKCLSNSDKTLDEGYGETLIGFLCLGLENKILSLGKFFSEVIDVMDSYEIVDLDIDDLLQLYKRDQFLSEEIQRLISYKFKKYRDNSNHLYRYLIDNELYKKERLMIEVQKITL